MDTGTREFDGARSTPVIESLVCLLREGAIAYKKVDSLLRGAWAVELAACLRSGFWTSCIVAPAFPYQGRMTRNAQQYQRTIEGSWSAVGDNLLAQLKAAGIDAQPGRSDLDVAEGVYAFDAESDDDLDRVVTIGRRAAGPVLWCGSGGLASALARGSNGTASACLRKPVLGLFGSDHPVTASQLAACGAAAITLVDRSDNSTRVRHKLVVDGVALVKFDPGDGLSRKEAALSIAHAVASLTAELDPPATLIVAGGETLRALCAALGATALTVTGRITPGLPRSIIKGGRWAGVPVISKSGAFGEPHLWLRLLQDNQLTIGRLRT